jgi:hypothetical protein
MSRITHVEVRFLRPVMVPGRYGYELGSLLIDGTSPSSEQCALFAEWPAEIACLNRLSCGVFRVVQTTRTADWPAAYHNWLLRGGRLLAEFEVAEAVASACKASEAQPA